MGDLRQTIRWMFDTTNALTGMQKVERKARGLKMKFGKLAGIIGGAFAGAAVVAGITNFTKQSVELAAKADGVREAFTKLGNVSLTGLQRAVAGTVSKFELMTQAVKAANFKVPLGQLETFFEFARKRSAQTGESVAWLVQSIIGAIGRKSALVFDNVGVSASELQAKIKEVGTFGEAAGALIREGLESMSDVAITAAQRMQALKANTENLKVEIGDNLLPVTERVLINLNDWAEALGRAFMSAKELAAVDVAKRVDIIKRTYKDPNEQAGAIENQMDALQTEIDALQQKLSSGGRFDVWGWWPAKKIEEAKQQVAKLEYQWQQYDDQLAKTLQDMGDAVAAPKESLKGLQETLKAYQEDQTLAKNRTEWLQVQEQIDATQAKIDKITNPAPIEAYTKKVAELKDGFADLHATIFNDVAGGQKGGGNVSAGFDAAQGYTGADIQEIEHDDGDLFAEQFVPEKGMQAIANRLLMLRENAAYFNQQFTQSMQGAAISAVIGMATMVGAMASGAANFADLGDFVLQTFAGMLEQLGAIAIETGMAVLAIKTALQDLNPFVAIAAGAALVALASSVRGQLGNLAGGNGPTSGPGQLWSQQTVPAMAAGGVVTAPTLAMVGEGNEPEAVIPLSRLNSMLNVGGGANASLVQALKQMRFKIEGNDLVAIVEKTTAKRLARYGT